ncbi:MAG: dimethylsulfonioproprionate lyase family protein [Pseudomonadota bacterium]
MTPAAQEQADRELFDALRAYVRSHPDPAIDSFRSAMEDWGERYAAVAPHPLPVAQTILDAAHRPDAHPLVGLFAEHWESRKWEQSYKKSDGFVGDDMLAGYGFAEIVGKWGPFVSEVIRSGVGAWGPGIVYPLHRHQANEIYILLAGSAEFTVGDTPPRQLSAGAVVPVPPQAIHGFRTHDEPAVVFYLWQNGDLRETSRFDV